MRETKTRPPQLTSGCYALMGSAVFVVLITFGRVQSLQTLAVRTSIEDALAKAPFSDWGWTVSQGVQAVFWLYVAMALAAAVIGILAWWMLKGDLSARTTASAAAVPLAVLGVATSSIAAMLMAGFVLMMWMEPARSWFAGRPIPERYLRPPNAAAAAARSGATATPGRPLAEAQQHARPPAALTRSAVLAGSFALFTALGAMSNILVLMVSPDRLLVQWRDATSWGDSLSDQDLIRYDIAASAVVLVWALVAAVLAVIAWRGVGWARTALMWSSIGAAIACLVAAFAGFAASLLPLFAAVLCARGLSSPEAKSFAGSAKTATKNQDEPPSPW